VVQRATDRFLAEIKLSHTVYSYVDVVSPTQQTVRLPVTGGSVTVDRTATTRRTCQVTCIDPLGVLVPTGTSSLLTPFGTELRPYRGVLYDDGTTEVVPLGIFRLSKSSVKTAATGAPQITLEASDLSRTVSRNKFLVPYTVATGTNLVTAVQGILALTFPDLQYDAISTTRTTAAPQLYDASSDPWTAVTSLASSLGCDIYFDVDGWVVIAPPPDISALPAPEFTYIDGQNCSLIDMTQVFTDDPGYNGVVVTGASPGNTAPAVTATAWDDDPASATYYLGPYGAVPQFVTDQTITTAADALTTAQALLSGQLGFSSQLSATGIVNPDYEAGDVVQVDQPGANVSGLYAVDAFTVPLDAASTQSLTLRAKKSTS
jgi:hypothetical protein